MSTGRCESLVSMVKKILNAQFLLRARAVLAKVCPIENIQLNLKTIVEAKIILSVVEFYGCGVIIPFC